MNPEKPGEQHPNDQHPSEKQIDEAVKQTFPASDPVSLHFDDDPDQQRPARNEAEGKPNDVKSGTRPGAKGREEGRTTESRPEASRGSSVQGGMQNAKGGPAGANQGGAPRGSSRLEPSHQHDQQKKDRKGQ